MSSSLIQLHFLDTQFFYVMDQLKQLENTQDTIDFHVIISRVIEILRKMSHLISMKTNNFGQKMPTVLFGNIFKYLPLTYFYSSCSTCKIWKKALNTLIPKQVHLCQQMESKVSWYVRSWKTHCNPRIMALYGHSFLFVDPYSSQIQKKWFYNMVPKIIFDSKKIIKQIAANDAYICILQEDDWIKVLTEKLDTFTLETMFRNVLSDPTYREFYIKNEYIYIVKFQTIVIYSLDGKFLKAWQTHKMLGNQFTLNGKIAVDTYTQQIFMVAPSLDSIVVFSKDGELLRKWGSRGVNEGEFRDPYGIAITDICVYISDTGNKRIQVFTYEGKFLFQINHPSFKELGQLFILNDQLYVSDWTVEKVFVFQLLF